MVLMGLETQKLHLIYLMQVFKNLDILPLLCFCNLRNLQMGSRYGFVTPDGDTYDASVDASVTPFNSTATEIGLMV